MDKRQSVKLFRKRKQLMWLYVFFLALLTVSIFLMPVSNIKDDSVVILYLSSATFWIGLVGTIYSAIKINHSRRVYSKFNDIAWNRQIGLINFFRNKPAIVFDIIMFVSLVGFVVSEVYIKNLIVTFIFFALFVFCFGMHCMLNGINYKYLKLNVRRDEES